MATGDQGDSLLVVHAHSSECGPDIEGRGGRVRAGVWALWVHIDETHVCGCQGHLEVLGTGAEVGAAVVAVRVALGEEGLLGAPVDGLVRLPRVDTATAVAEGWEAHVLERNVAGEDDQVTPRDLAAVLLLDGPHQTTGLVQAGIVRPAVERCKALLAHARPSAAVEGPVCACAVPCHTDEQTAIVAKVSRPEGLGVPQQGLEVGLDSIDWSRVSWRSARVFFVICLVRAHVTYGPGS